MQRLRQIALLVSADECCFQIVSVDRQSPHSNNMLCTVCCNGLEGIWDPSKTQRLGLRSSWKSSEHNYLKYLRETQDAGKRFHIIYLGLEG